ncbi:MAG: M48 family metalloprotease [Candidatus Omnitrophica bacterium]|nr:M48 family metalloprotease [Candidatus Omnitrophota bacterium]
MCRIVKYLLFGLFMFIAGCVTIYNPATGRQETYFIDENTEISMGRNLASQILRENKVVRDKRLLFYVRGIGRRLAESSDRKLDYNFYVLDKKEINAFALPGGYIFVNRGLIDKADRDELAFVLGHEIGHVCARHSVKRLQISLGFDLVLSMALSKPKHEDIRKGIGSVYNIISLGYSRQDEFLADSLGVKYAQRAGFNPWGAVSMLRKLKREGRQQPVVFLSSHPPAEERIRRVEEKINRMRK